MQRNKPDPFPVLTRLFTDNPVLIREVRRRMRGRGLTAALIIYILALCAVVGYIITTESTQWVSQMQSSGFAYGVTISLSDIGRQIYTAIMIIEVIIVIVLAPTLTYATVRAERTRETFEFLKVTAIDALVYVVGAFTSAMMYVALALLAAMPVVMLAYLYGGVSGIMTITAYLLGLSAMLSAMGLAAACGAESEKQSRGAVAVLVVAAIVVAQIMIFVILPVARQGGLSLGPAVVGISPAALAALLIAIITVLSLIAAVRRLFSPEERLFSYWQFALVAAALWALVIFQTRAIATTPSSGTFAPVLYTLGSLALFVSLIGIVSHGLSVAEVPNERWRLHQRLPVFKAVDDRLLFMLVLVAGVSVGLWIAMGLCGVTSDTATIAVTPILAFSLLLVGLTIGLRRKFGDEGTGAAIVVYVALIWSIAPVVLNVFFTSGMSTSWTLLRALSPPVAAAMLAANPQGQPALISLAIISIAAVSIWLWALVAKPRVESARAAA